MTAYTYVGDGNTGDGASFGVNASSKIALYGLTPVVQRTSTVLATSLLSASTYVSVASNTAAILLEMTSALIALGAYKTA